MCRAVYPGSFDPITNGHLDIIQRGCKLFDKITIGVLVNQQKSPLFTVEERIEIIRQVVEPLQSPKTLIEVESFSGLLVDFAQQKRADCIVRGLRAVSDYEYELQMAQMNRHMESDIETVFLMSDEAYSFVSSRLVKEIFILGRPVSQFVPALVEERMREKVSGVGCRVSGSET